MPIENSTANRCYLLPASPNSLKVDVARLIAAMVAIDVDMQTALVVAGVYGSAEMSATAVEAAKNATGPAKDQLILQTPGVIPAVMGKSAGLIMFLLALAAFPPACFSSFIAANSFKTTLPNVNPFISVGIGAAVTPLMTTRSATPTWRSSSSSAT